jgi:hypothetical protein
MNKNQIPLLDSPKTSLADKLRNNLLDQLLKTGEDWPFKWHKLQQEALDSEKRFVFAVAGWQGGKSVMGCYWLPREIRKFKPPGIYYVVAPTYAMLASTNIPKFFEFFPNLEQYFNKQNNVINYPNRDKLFFKSADEPRRLLGPTLNAVWIDEISDCGQDGGKEVFEICQGRVLTTKGRILCTGTPKGVQFLGDIRRRANRKVTTYSFHRWSSSANPCADKDFIAEISRDWSEDQRRQELEAELIDWTDAVFKESYVTAATDNTASLLPPEPGHKYVSGWDVAKKHDWTVGFTIDLETNYIVAYERFQHRPWAKVAEAIDDRARDYPGTTVVDTTGIGSVLYELITAPNVEEFIFSGKTKSDLINHCVHAIERNGIKFPKIDQLIKELLSYRWEDKKIVKDCVMALALTVHAVEFGKAPAACLGKDREPDLFGQQETHKPDVRIRKLKRKIKENYEYLGMVSRLGHKKPPKDWRDVRTKNEKLKEELLEIEEKDAGEIMDQSCFKRHIGMFGMRRSLLF